MVTDPKNTPTHTPTGSASTAHTPSDTAHEARSSAEDIKNRAMAGASRAADEARHQATDLAHQARDAAYDGANRVRAEAERRAQAGVDRGADEVSNTANALRRASDEAGENSIQGQVLRYAADGLTDISDTIRGKSLGDMVADVAEFGRRNPVAFLGGAALAGFAISRFVRASRPQPRYEGPRYDGPRGPYGGPPSPGYRAGTMSQPGQPATTHTPVRPSGAPVTGAAPGFESVKTPGDKSVSVPATAGATPVTDSGKAGGTTKPADKASTKGTPNV